MQLSKHAEIRAQQRGIPKDYIEMIMEYGTPTRKPGNALEYKMHKKTRDQVMRQLKQLMILIDRCANKAVLVDGDQKEIITVYHLN